MARTQPADVNRHPIGVVSARTGLSVELLRAWERRYAVVQPHRSDDGRRLYSDGDIERLSLIHRAIRAGRSVATLAPLSSAELRRMVAEDAEHASSRPARSASYHEQAMTAVRALQPERLEALLRRGLLALGAVTFLEEVVGPLLVDIGEAWHDGRITVAHEHAASATLLQLLGWLTRMLEIPGDAPRVVLATPRGELHALGGMMAAAVAAHEGWRVTWLGPDLPAEYVAVAAKKEGARAVGLSVVSGAGDQHHELHALRAALPQPVPLLVGGAGAARLADVRGVTKVRDLEHWGALLRSHSATAA